MHGSRRHLIEVLVRYDERLGRQIDRLRTLSRRLSTIRLALVIGGAVAGFAVYRFLGDLAGGLLLLLLVAIFAVVAVYHSRIERSLDRHECWRSLKRTHLARIRLEWSAIPPPTVVVPDFHHPFEADLNLTGQRSLLQLIDTTTTPGGHARLLKWLRQGSPAPDAVRRRQSLVRALIGSSLFMDRLMLESELLAGGSGRDEETDVVRMVLHRHASPTAKKLALLSALAAANGLFVALDVAGVADLLWAFSFPIYAVLYLAQYRMLAGLFDRAEDLYYALRRFAGLFRRIERHRFSRPELAALCEPIQTPAEPPSRVLKRAARIAAAGTQKSEILTLVLNVIGPWDLYFAHRLEAFKEQLRGRLPAWMDVWHELEALSALATYATLHPLATFPTLTDDPTASLLDATGLGHPLIREEDKVRNDFVLTSPGEICLLTGSNMSGKSTFLRTIGVNLVLAAAGAPVDAEAFAWRPVRLFSCLQVSDSVNDGISYFYAEVRRLRQLLEAARAPALEPLLFLIDEIFRGTNNRERLIGSRAYIEALAREHAAGLIATHDLELVTLEREIPTIRNMHFREEVEEGRMVFDYRIHTGPSPTTNALQIMKMEGLPVGR